MGEYQNQHTNQRSRAISSQVSSNNTEHKSSAVSSSLDNRADSIRFKQLQEAADAFTKKNRLLPMQLRAKGDNKGAQEQLDKRVEVPSIQPTPDDIEKAKQEISDQKQEALNMDRIPGEQQHNNSKAASQQRLQRDSEQNQRRFETLTSGGKLSESDKQSQFDHERYSMKNMQDRINKKANSIAETRFSSLQQHNASLVQKAIQLKNKT